MHAKLNLGFHTVTTFGIAEFCVKRAFYVCDFRPKKTFSLETSTAESGMVLIYEERFQLPLPIYSNWSYCATYFENTITVPELFGQTQNKLQRIRYTKTPGG